MKPNDGTVHDFELDSLFPVKLLLNGVTLITYGDIGLAAVSEE